MIIQGFIQRYRMLNLVTVTAATIGLTACGGMGTKETIGTLGGGALGGFAGSQIGKKGSTGNLAATAGLALLGAWFGNEIGKSLDRADRLSAERSALEAFEYAPDGQERRWQNPNKNTSGYTKPTRTYKSQTRNYEVCREYQSSVVIDGRIETATGTACRQPNGTWQIIS